MIDETNHLYRICSFRLTLIIRSISFDLMLLFPSITIHEESHLVKQVESPLVDTVGNDAVDSFSLVQALPIGETDLFYQFHLV